MTVLAGLTFSVRIGRFTIDKYLLPKEDWVRTPVIDRWMDT